jgi:hypothetical protein
MMDSIQDIENYLNSKVNVDGNPHDNLFLYKDWIKKNKGIDILHKDFGKMEYLTEYITEMYKIGWDKPVELPEPIPKEDLEIQIKEVIETFGSTEEILYQASILEGRECVAHRTLRGWPSFIGTVIFGEVYDPIKIRYSNFKYGSGKEQILRWASLYYISIRSEFE